MRSICFLSLAVIATSSSSEVGWPSWPWGSSTSTPAPDSLSVFEHGVAEALGFEDVSTCIKDTNASVAELWQGTSDYLNGNWIAKAKALAKIGMGVVDIVKALEPCSASLSHAERYEQLVKGLLDPRFYTMHNAMTLCLNLAEDHSQLETFAQNWRKGEYQPAGKELTTVILDVLANPGIPDKTGTEATNVGIGFGESFVSNIALPCFADAAVEIPAIAGGVIEIMSGALALPGLESLFHGIEYLVPTIKACVADEPKIIALIHAAGDFRHPAELAKIYASNIEKGALDLSLETAAAVLDYKGKEWRRFGQDLGKMCAKIFIPSDTLVVV